MDYASMNLAVIVGNLCNDPELRQGKGKKGKSFCWLSVATNEAFAKGEDKKSTFHNVMVFGQRAEFAAKYLKKGTGIMVQGKMYRSFWSSDGERRSTVQVIAEKITFPPKPKEPELEGSAEAGEEEEKEEEEGEPF